MPARSYILQNAYPRRPDYSFRVHDGAGRRDQTAQLRWLADMLDTRFRLPGGFRIGWDGILGLIPGAGDLLTSGLSFYIILQAALLGAPPAVLARMGLNVLIDNLFDFLPVVGNLFDFVWKSNAKNMALLDRYLADPSRVAKRSKWAVAFTVAGVIAFAAVLIAGAVAASVLAFRWLLSAL